MVISLILFFQFIEFLPFYLIHLSTKQDILRCVRASGLEQSHAPRMHALIGRFLVKPHISSVNGRVVVSVVSGTVFARLGRAKEAGKGVVGSTGWLAGATVTMLLAAIMGYQEVGKDAYQYDGQKTSEDHACDHTCVRRGR